jgi:hypothetical protein
LFLRYLAQLIYRYLSSGTHAEPCEGIVTPVWLLYVKQSADFRAASKSLLSSVQS